MSSLHSLYPIPLINYSVHYRRERTLFFGKTSRSTYFLQHVIGGRQTSDTSSRNGNFQASSRSSGKSQKIVIRLFGYCGGISCRLDIVTLRVQLERRSIYLRCRGKRRNLACYTQCKDTRCDDLHVIAVEDVIGRPYSTASPAGCCSDIFSSIKGRRRTPLVPRQAQNRKNGS